MESYIYRKCLKWISNSVDCDFSNIMYHDTKKSFIRIGCFNLFANIYDCNYSVSSGTCPLSEDYPHIVSRLQATLSKDKLKLTPRYQQVAIWT